MVFLIAAANPAVLLLSRGTARQRGIAVHVALGASGVRLLRQIETESLTAKAIGLQGPALAEAHDVSTSTAALYQGLG